MDEEYNDYPYDEEEEFPEDEYPEEEYPEEDEYDDPYDSGYSSSINDTPKTVDFTGDIKVLWAKLPITMKLTIIGGIGFLFFLLMGVVILNGYKSLLHLEFSDSVDDTVANSDESYVDLYSDTWYDLCVDSDDPSCTEEQKEENQKLVNDQQKFYKKLNKQNLTKKQRAMVVATIFYGYDIDTFDAGNAFDDEDTTDEDVTVETETTDSESESQEQEIQTIDLAEEKGHIKKLSKAAKKDSTGEYFFNTFLLENKYLDSKPDAPKYRENYAKAHKLDKDDWKDWDEEDLKAYRKEMADEIKEIVLEYLGDDELNATMLSNCSSGEYLLPIGSTETTEQNGVLFATGKPVDVYISSHAFARDSAHQDHDHGGTDFANVTGSASGINIIAAANGTVIQANDSCPTMGYLGSKCGGGFGNYVYIQEPNGYIEIYGHMASGTVKVKEGDTVKQGQVLGKMGSSGSSTGYHLHFEMHDESGNKINPEDYVSIENPRPTGNNSSGCLNGAVSGESNIQTACLTLLNSGYNEVATAAVLINFTSEAHYDTECINSIGAAGLAQWYKERFDNLRNTYGDQWITIENQISFFLYELDNNVKPGSKNILLNASDVGSTARAFCNKFEVPGDEYCAPRQNSALAKRYLDFVKNGCNGNVVRMGPDTADCVQRHGSFSEDLQ